MRQATYYAIWLLGLAVAVDALGFSPETVVTGLGLTGLALGFARGRIRCTVPSSRRAPPSDSARSRR